MSLALPAGLLALLLSENPTLMERVEHYDVAGSTAREIRSEMDRLRPKDDNGDRFDAFTRWYVRWQYKYSTKGGTCSVASVTTSLDVTTKLPRWSRDRGAAASLVARWQSYLRALEDHEKGHAQIGIRAATQVQEELSSFEPYPDCPRLGEALDARGQAILDDFRREEVDYDRRTRHGMRDGAVFP